MVGQGKHQLRCVGEKIEKVFTFDCAMRRELSLALESRAQPSLSLSAASNIRISDEVGADSGIDTQWGVDLAPRLKTEEERSRTITPSA
jgi:hypothetical protein